MATRSGSDRKALIFGTVFGLATGLIARLFMSPAGQRIDAVLPSFWPGNSTSDIIVGAMMVVALFVLPPITTGLARRFTFLWGFLPTVIAAYAMGFDPIGLQMTIPFAVLLTSGPVAAIRYFRTRPMGISAKRASVFVFAVAVIFASLWGLGMYSLNDIRNPTIRTGLVECKSMQFVAHVSFAKPAGGSWTEVLPGPTYSVQALQPSSVRIELRPSTALADKKAPFGLYVTNPLSQIECGVSGSECSTTLGSMLLRTMDQGEARVIDPDVIFADKPFQGWYSNGDDVTIEGRNVHPFIRHHTENGAEHMQRLYIGGDNLPVRVSDYEYNSAGHFIETRRTDYSNWRLNPHIDPSVFTASGDATSTPTAR